MEEYRPNMITEEPEPFYYKGWAIWPSPMGLITCERTDTALPETTTFGSVEDAIGFINSQTDKRKKLNGGQNR